MFQTILIPLDLTEKHERVLNTVQNLARKDRSKVVLVHVVEMIAGSEREEEEEFYGRLEQTAEKYLAGHAAAFAKQGIEVDTKVIFGHRSRDVAKYATAVGADLIVVTAPQFDPDKPGAGFASLSWKIGILASCPVLLVK